MAGSVREMDTSGAGQNQTMFFKTGSTIATLENRTAYINRQLYIACKVVNCPQYGLPFCLHSEAFGSTILKSLGEGSLHAARCTVQRII